jgi:hypothetical protein
VGASKTEVGPGVVAHAYNLSYFLIYCSSEDQKDLSLRLALAKG